MDLDTLIIAAFCRIDDALKACLADQDGTVRLRQGGPAPKLADSEVLTMEAVGAFLKMEEDAALFAYFRRHCLHLFPALAGVSRTSLTRQAANLWRVKEALWQHLARQTPHDPQLTLVDSFALPVCRFARAPRCKRFRDQAAFGYDPVAQNTFWGFRVHALMAWPGVLVRLYVAPANQQELDVLPDLARGQGGTVLGDRNYWSPKKRDLLAAEGVTLRAPYRNKKHDPHPKASRLMSRLRYHIDTVFGQMCERFAVKQVWARDAWHLTSRLLRVALSHTLMVAINLDRGNEPLQLSQLLPI